MEAKRIKVVKNWSKFKSARNIQVFLGFANFYRQFIQGFNRITALFTSIFKTTRSSNKPAPNWNNSSKSASSRNNNNKPASGKNNGNGEIDKFGNDSVKHAKKPEK